MLTLGDEQKQIPVLGFAAFSGAGKTTLLTEIIPLLIDRGLRIGLIKHAHHSFQIDRPGKDSYRLRQAGAVQLVLAARSRTAVIIEHPLATHEPGLVDQFRHLDCDNLDLVLVEGFKREAIPKIEVHRSGLGHPYLYTDDPNIIALVTDVPPSKILNIPVLNINQPKQVAEFISNTWLPDDTPKR